MCFGCSGSCLNIQPGETKIPRPQPFSYKNKKSDEQKKALMKYISDRVVRIVVVRSLVDYETNKVLIRHQKAGWGSGTIIRSMGGYSYILTALHVVDKNTEIDIDSFFAGKNRYWVYYYLIEKRTMQNKVIFTYGGSKVIHKDKYRDIAVLKVPKDFGLQTQIAHNIYLGEEVHIVGYPWLWAVKGSHLSYTHGYIGTINLGNEENKTGQRDHDRIDADAYMGNSGSSVFNNQGKIVSVVNWITGVRIGGLFLPRPKQTFGCSSRGVLKSFRKSGLRELSRF